jgi:hypothetical protein
MAPAIYLNKVPQLQVVRVKRPMPKRGCGLEGKLCVDA